MSGQSRLAQSPADAPIPPPLESVKKRFAHSNFHPSHAKRSRVYEPQILNSERESLQIKLQQPQPRRPNETLLLRDLVDGTQAESTDSFISNWLESIEPQLVQTSQSEPSPEQPDLHLEPLSRQCAWSAPEMSVNYPGNRGMPQKPVSTQPRISRPSLVNERGRSASAASTTAASVRSPRYRETNLLLNKVVIQDSLMELPAHAQDHLEIMQQIRTSPGPSPEQIAQHFRRLDILARGCTETQVEEALYGAAFPASDQSDPVYRLQSGLASSTGALMSQHLVPADTLSPFRVSQPKPDKLYGYSGNPADGAFTQSQLLAQTLIEPGNPDFPAATSQGLRFPFLAVEFKAAGGTRGDLWVAANQCAGASAACLAAVGRLNAALRAQGEEGDNSGNIDNAMQSVDNVAYSVAVDNNIAQLYVSWRDENDSHFYVQRVGAYLLSCRDHFVTFRAQVRNILDWGLGARLSQIRAALDSLLEQERIRAANRSKSRLQQ